jgi:predicted ATPase/Tfp pilus assembly protein PilF
LNNTAVIFPVRPHPKIKPSKGVEMLPLFAGKPSWGTQLKFSGCKEQLIAGTYVRLDKYEPMATKEFYSPVYETEYIDLSELGIESVLMPLPKGVAPKEKKAKTIPHNLPSPPTPFLGRERELAEIGKLFEDPSCRLVTLLGPGGIGKTRLSLQAASQRIGEFQHGVYFVPLAPLSSSDFLVSTIAKSLEFSFRGSEEPKVQLHNYLREKEMLLVMDNFEHLIDGASLVAEVLEAAPKVKIIVSSRERLNLKGEWILKVEGMCCPETGDVDTIAQYGAARLFLEGVQRVRPDFTLTEDMIPYVIRICRLVSGMPLAIELASAWMSVLSCKEVVEEIEQNIDFLATSMRDVPERHRSMRAVFEHSWDLLSDAEKNVFMKMSVFRGGFQRDAAKDVTKASLLLLSELVNKSLLQHYPSGRYVVHELLRQYAEEKLASAPQEKEEVHDRHSKFYCEFMCQRKKSLRGERQREVLEEIGEEIDNVRAAWIWAVEKGNINALDRCFDSLWRFYIVRGWYQDGEEMFGQATEKLEGSLEEIGGEKEIIFGNILERHGVFSLQLGHYDKAEELLQRSIRIFRKHDAQKNIADTLTELSRFDYIKGDYPKAKQTFEESLSIYKKIGLRDRMAVPYTMLGNIAYRLGKLKLAREHYQKSYLIYKEIGDRWGMAIILMNMANIEHELGEHSEAKRLYGESLSIGRELGDRRGIASNLNNMGNVLKDLGEHAEAKKLYQESLEIKREIGDRYGIASTLGNLGNIAGALGDYDEAKRFHKESLDLSREIGYRWGLVGALIALGTDLCETGECEQSREYFYEGLDIAMKISSIPQALDALVGIAILFKEDKEKALEIFSFVACNPSSYIHTRNKVEELRHEIAAKLPPHVAEATQKRGEARKLEDVVEEILKKK